MILYKYLTFERIDVLQNCKIRFSQPPALNDPYEVKISFTQFTSDKEAFETFNDVFPKALYSKYNEFPEEARKLISFDDFINFTKMYMPDPFKDFKAILDYHTPRIRDQIAEIFREQIGILSLTESRNNNLMWSHYSNSHQGFVIGFDSNHPFFYQKVSDFDELRHLRKVEYREKRPSGPMTELEGVDVFLVKSKQWEYENEWRIIRPLVDADEVIDVKPFPIHLFSFPKEIVQEVIFGYNMIDAHKEELRTLINVKYKNTQLFQASVNDDDYGLSIRQL